MGGKGTTTGVGSINPNENAPDAGLSHGALVEQLLSSEAVSSAQLIPRSRSDHPLRLDELVGTLSPSKFVHSCPAQCQRLIVPFEEPVRCMQHAVALGCRLVQPRASRTFSSHLVRSRLFIGEDLPEHRLQRAASFVRLHRLKNIETADATGIATRSRPARTRYQPGSAESSSAPAWQSHN